MSKIQMPEPVAAMWEDRHDGRMMPTTRFSGWPPFEPLAEFDALITTDQAEAYAEARVCEALEEASDNYLKTKDLIK